LFGLGFQTVHFRCRMILADFAKVENNRQTVLSLRKEREREGANENVSEFEWERMCESVCVIGNVFSSFYFRLWDVKVVFSTSLFTHARALDEKPTYYSMELYSVTKGSEQGSLRRQIDSAMGLAQRWSVAWTLKLELQFCA